MHQVLVLFALILCLQQISAQLNVTRINNGDLYVYTDGLYFGMFMVTPSGVIAVDAPPSIAGTGKTIPEIIAEVTSKPIKWVIYSHHHLDHIGAAAAFPSDAEVICHKAASHMIKETPSVPECTRIVKNEGYTLKIDSKHIIELEYRGTIHTEGNLYIYVPNDKLLMLIDFVFPQWGPYHSLGMASSVARYWDAFDKVLKYDFEYYVGGHVDRIGSRNDVEVGKQLISDLVDSVKQALKTVNETEIVEQNGGYNGKNSFTIYRAYTDAIADECVNIMMNEKDWGSKLIDAGAYMDTHCFVISEYVDIQF